MIMEQFAVQDNQKVGWVMKNIKTQNIFKPFLLPRVPWSLLTMWEKPEEAASGT